jgi:YcxB-like protein
MGIRSICVPSTYDLRRFWTASISMLLVVVLLLFAFVLFVSFFLPWLGAQSLFRKYPAFRKARRSSFSNDGVHLESEDAQGHYKWSLFSRIAETPKTFFLMQTARSATYVPKRCLKAEDIPMLRRLIRQNFTGKLTPRGD